MFNFKMEGASQLIPPEFLRRDGDVEVILRNLHESTFPSPNPPTLNLNIPEVAQFQIQQGREVNYIPYEQATDDVLRMYLLGSCMGALLQQQGFIVLHGNAVTFDNKTCNIFIGEQGAGKSTATAWHYQQGASMLADDICAVSFNAKGRPIVLPSFPQVKLWQSTADLLGISTQHLTRIRQGADKFILPIPEEKFCQTPCKIKEIFEIDPQTKTQQRLTGHKKLLRLQYHSYRYSFLSQMGLEYGYLKKLMRLAQLIELHKMPRLIIPTLNSEKEHAA